MKSSYKWSLLGAAGAILAVAVIVFRFWVSPMVLKQQISQKLALNNGTDVWDRFVNPPVSFYLKVYIFNFVNPEEVFDGKKPLVKQVGPWVYKMTKKKEIISVNNGNRDTVEFRVKTIMTFDENKSKPLTEHDFVQPANPIVPLVYTFTERLPEINFLTEVLEIGFPEVLGVNYATRLNVTVKELLFDGITGYCSANVSLSAKSLCASIANIPEQRIAQWDQNGDLKFSVLKARNDSLSGYFEIYRGNYNSDSLGEIFAVNGKPQGNDWYGTECNKIQGYYTETVLKPLMTEETTFRIYDEEICAGVPMSYESSHTNRGVDVLRFQTSDSFLGSVTDYPENYCYCPGSIRGLTLAQGCLKKGAMEISACRSVSEILSFPHFMKASDEYRSMIDGLTPDVDQHTSYADVEPNTGIPLSARKRVQINFEMKGTPSVKITGQAPDVLMPLLWIEESVDLGDDEVQLLKNQLLNVLHILSIAQWVLFGSGASAAIICFLIALFAHHKSRR